MMSKAIGIDLGTTYSCVAAFLDGVPTALKTKASNGITVTSSYVGFDDEGHVIVGTAATGAVQKVKNLVYDSKRMIGRRFDDPVIQERLRTWRFEVINVNGYPTIQLDKNTPGLRRYTYSPEDISAEILKYLRQQVVEYRLGHKLLPEAVVTVPAYFNTNQRKRTKQAAEMAGFKVLSLLSEPVAAAIAYAHEGKHFNDETLLVFDLGGGTLDVTILTVGDNNNFVVKAHAGNTSLGGQDFTQKVMDYAVKYFEDQYKDIKLTDEDKHDLWKGCESAKCFLSDDECYQTRINVARKTISYARATFERDNEKDFQSSIKCIENALRFANLGVKDINRVLLTGGSTRIPIIREKVKAFFLGTPVHTDIDPDEAVAKGAAIYAAVLTGDLSVKLRNFDLSDVTPLSLGVSTEPGDMTTVVERNLKIPVHRSHNLVTSIDDQTSCSFSIYAGERPLVKDNTYLGKIELNNITVAPRGVTEFEVKFEVDKNGILTVSAAEKGTTNCGRIEIKPDDDVNCIDIGSSLTAAAVNKLGDDAVRKKQAARKTFTDYVYEKKHSAQQDKQNSSGKAKMILEKCAELIKWIDESALADDSTYDAKRNELDLVCRL